MPRNQQQLAERFRQNQLGTEKRIFVQNAAWMSRGEPNPLIEFFKDDLIIAELDVDVELLKKHFALDYVCDPGCLLPCFWPLQIVGCTPLVMSCRFCSVDAAVKAHHLVLRERSIEYRVEMYRPVEKAACVCQLCEHKVGGIHEVYPLTDVSFIGAEACQIQYFGCCGNVSPDTMVLRLSSLPDGRAAAAIDAPKNAEDFARRVLEQKEQQKTNSSVEIPPDVMQSYNTYMSAKFFCGGLPGPMAASPTPQVMGNPAPGGAKDLSTQIAELKALNDQGVLTDEEFTAAKAKLMT